MELFGFHIPAQLLGGILAGLGVMALTGLFFLVDMVNTEKASQARRLVAQQAAADHAAAGVAQQAGLVRKQRAPAVDLAGELAQVKQV